jgi:hypothetical protein
MRDVPSNKPLGSRENAMSVPHAHAPYLLAANIDGADAILRIDPDLMGTGSLTEGVLELCLRGITDPPDALSYLREGIGKAIEHDLAPGTPTRIWLSSNFCEPIEISCSSAAERRSSHHPMDLSMKASILARLLGELIDSYNALEESTTMLRTDLQRLVAHESDRSERIVHFFGRAHAARAEKARGKKEILSQLANILERVFGKPL